MFLRLSLRWLMSFFIVMLISRWVVGSLLKSRKLNQMFQQMLSVVLHKITFSGYKYYVGHGNDVSLNQFLVIPELALNPDMIIRNRAFYSNSMLILLAHHAIYSWTSVSQTEIFRKQWIGENIFHLSLLRLVMTYYYHIAFYDTKYKYI